MMLLGSMNGGNSPYKGAGNLPTPVDARRLHNANRHNFSSTLSAMPALPLPSPSTPSGSVFARMSTSPSELKRIY